MTLPIPQFDVRDRRSIRRASCDSVPKIMIVTGPNGCGKSTLLDELRQRSDSGGSILYVGPHRTSGRQKVQMRYAAGERLSMRELQSRQDLPNHEGIKIHSYSRSAWDYDETSNYLKYSLCQVELNRRDAFFERYEKHPGAMGPMPDVWKPLRELTENLLPHLRFERIDNSDRRNIKCLWNVHAKNIQVDIDDLSSGEKAIIQLFFPIIENRVQVLIDQGSDADNGGRDATEPVCVLMDEPELHLHPNLQGKVLDYLRRLTSREAIQFILATHSLTIVEQADSNELFLLQPSETMADDATDNQLVRIASSDEKLATIRSVFGSVSNVTALRTILVVEGVQANMHSRTAADERILSHLNPLFSQVTVLTGGGKAQCKQLARNLARIFSGELSSRIGAYALVDRDLDVVDVNEDDPRVKYLPVSMIENLLVDPKVIWDAISLTRHKTELQSSGDVEESLDQILDDLEEHEIDRRIKDKIGYFGFRAKDPLSDLQGQVATHVQELQDKTAEATITELRKQCHEEIHELTRKKERRENYSGKEILRRFYGTHLNNGMMSKELFVYECARAAANRKSVRDFVDNLFQEISTVSVG